MKQTAVEWLINRIAEKELRTEIEWKEIFEQAKAMEKEQIENAYWDGGQDVPTTEKICEQYYAQTYNQNQPSPPKP